LRLEVPTLLRADLAAVTDRDPACIDAAHCLMHFKGFLSLASHRVAHVLWQRGRRRLAVAFQSRCSEVKSDGASTLLVDGVGEGKRESEGKRERERERESKSESGKKLN
jgi:hypothetical protein